VARGRPVSKREVFAFGESRVWPPQEALVDSDFIGRAFFTNENNHAECLEALVDMVISDTAIVYSSQLEVELAEVAYKIALRERYGAAWGERRADGRCRARADRITKRIMDSWFSVVQVANVRRIDVTDVQAQVPEMMRRYGLKSYDAIHLATSFEATVPVIVTTDRDFAEVPAAQLRIHTAASCVPGMRRRRALRRRRRR
jgi:predicted nucleic acid-binding protein